jgi:hypothetical protein
MSHYKIVIYSALGSGKKSGSPISIPISYMPFLPISATVSSILADETLCAAACGMPPAYRSSREDLAAC